MKHKTFRRGDIRRGHRATVNNNSIGNRFERKLLGHRVTLFRAPLYTINKRNMEDLGFFEEEYGELIQEQSVQSENKTPQEHPEETQLTMS